MKATKAIVVTFALALGLAAMIPATRADQVIGANESVLTFNEGTHFNFSEPVEIPGRVLPAGSYWFIMADTATGNTVQIFDNDKRLITTLQTASTERYDTTERTLVILAEGGAGKPDAIIQWYYPDFRIGHEFLYPKEERKALEEQPVKTIVTPGYLKQVSVNHRADVIE